MRVKASSADSTPLCKRCAEVICACFHCREAHVMLQVLTGGQRIIQIGPGAAVARCGRGLHGWQEPPRATAGHLSCTSSGFSPPICVKRQAI